MSLAPLTPLVFVDVDGSPDRDCRMQEDALVHRRQHDSIHAFRPESEDPSSNR